MSQSPVVAPDHRGNSQLLAWCQELLTCETEAKALSALLERVTSVADAAAAVVQLSESRQFYRVCSFRSPRDFAFGETVAPVLSELALPHARAAFEETEFVAYAIDEAVYAEPGEGKEARASEFYLVLANQVPDEIGIQVATHVRFVASVLEQLSVTGWLYDENERAKQHVQELARSSSAVGVLDPDMALSNLLAALAELIVADVVLAFFPSLSFDDDSDDLVFEAGYGVGEEVANTLSLADGGNLRGHLAEIEEPTALELSTPGGPGYGLALPLESDSRGLGAILVVSTAGLVEVDNIDIVMAIIQLGTHAIDNARIHYRALQSKRMETELDIAGGIQTGLLPKAFPSDCGLEIAGVNLPCDQSGGDFYDVMRLDDGRVAMILADATGHGIAAAIVAVTCRALFRGAVGNASGLGTTRSLAEFVTGFNRLLCEDLPDERFVTAFIAIYDPKSRTLDFVNAGHEPPLFMRSGSDEVEQLPSGGPPLGLFPFLDYQGESRGDLNDRDLLLIVTDGVTESMNVDKDQFGYERLLDQLRVSRELTAAEILDSLREKVAEHRGEQPPFDDETTLCFRVASGDGAVTPPER